MPCTIYKSRQVLTFSLGGDEHELSCELHYECAFGTPESGRFSGPPEDYDPGSPDEVTLTRAFLTEPDLTQDALPGWMFNLLAEDNELLSTLADEAREDDIAARDAAAEMRAEDRRLEARS